MFSRQQIWRPILSVTPALGPFCERYLPQDPLSSRCTGLVDLHPERIYVAMETDRKGNEVAALMGCTATVKAEACDPAAAAEDKFTHMGVGIATALSDTLNTLHIMARLLPGTPAHVTINMQTQAGPAMEHLRPGAEIAVVSTIDKLGKTVAYCSTDIFVLAPDSDSGSKSSAARIIAAPQSKEEEELWAAREAKIASLPQLKRALGYYDRAFHNAHVKAILKQSII